jgi:hypothetical protein
MSRSIFGAQCAIAADDQSSARRRCIEPCIGSALFRPAYFRGCHLECSSVWSHGSRWSRVDRRATHLSGQQFAQRRRRDVVKVAERRRNFLDFTCRDSEVLKVSTPLAHDAPHISHYLAGCSA